MYTLKVKCQQLMCTYFLLSGGNMNEFNDVNIDEKEILYKGNKSIEERKLND